MATNKINGVTAPAKVNGILAANISKLLGTVFTAGGVATAALALNFITATIAADGSPDADSGTTALTYTGATHKRQWNSEGVLEYAPHNFVLRNQSINAYWTLQGSVTVSDDNGADPYGNASASSFVEFTASTADGVMSPLVGTLMVNAGLNVGFWFKKVTGSHSLQVDNANDSLRGRWHMDLSALSTDWEWITEDHAAVTVQSGGQFKTGGSANGYFIFRIRNSVVGTACSFYLDYATATAKPSTLTPLLNDNASILYGARAGTSCRKPVTNLATYPEAIDDDIVGTPWNGQNQVTTSGGQTDPLGGTSAVNTLPTTNNQVHYAGRTDLTATNVPTTLSVYAEPNGYDRAALVFSSTTGNARFHLSGDGAVTFKGSTALDAGIVAVPGTGYYRIWVTVDMTATLCRLHVCNDDSLNAFVGSGTDGVSFWGANVTEGGIQDYIGATNLLNADKAFTDAAWTKTNVTATDGDLAPDGSTDADAITSQSTETSSRFVERTETLSAGTYNLSFFARAKELNFLRVYANINGSVGRAYFDLTNGTTGTVQAGIDSTKLQYIGGGVYRCSIVWTENTGGSRPLGFGMSDADNTTSFSGTAGDGMTVFGAQLTKGATLYPYVGMPQTAFIQQGYQSEGDATNLCAASETLTDTGTWTILNTNSVTVTANQSAGPDGLTSLDKIAIDNNSNIPHGLFFNLNYTANNDHAISAFLRAEEVRYVTISHSNSTEHFFAVTYDLIGGVVTNTDAGTNSGTVNGFGMIPCGDGLYYCWVSGSINRTDSTSPVVIGPCATSTGTGDRGWEQYSGTTGDGFYAGGVQVETGTYPSSYIATFGGTDDRDADDLTDATMAWHNDTVISPIIDAVIGGGVGDADKVLMEINTTGSNSDVYVNTSSQMQSRDGGTNITGFTDTVADNGRYKVASKWAANDQGVSMNGSVADTNTSANHYGGTQTALEIGRRSTGDSLNGYVRTIEIWDSDRSDVELATDSLITDDGTRWVDEQLAG